MPSPKDENAALAERTNAALDKLAMDSLERLEAPTGGEIDEAFIIVRNGIASLLARLAEAQGAHKAQVEVSAEYLGVADRETDRADRAEARLAEADEAVEELAVELAEERTLHQQTIEERDLCRSELERCGG